MNFTIEDQHINGKLGFGEIQVSPDEKNGYRPFELFVSSLAGCSGSLLRNILTKRRIPFRKIQIQVSSVRNPDHANRIEQLAFTAYIESEKTINPQLAEKMASLVIKNCGMIQSVIQSINISYRIQSISFTGEK